MFTALQQTPISCAILIITVVLLISMIRVNQRIAVLNAKQEAEMAAEHAAMEAESAAEQ